MDVLLAIPNKNQAQYAAQMADAIGAQTVRPGHTLYMPDRPTGRELVEIRKTLAKYPDIEVYPVSSLPSYVGRPNMNAGADWFLAGHVRNVAVSYMVDKGFDAVVFIDGDCIPEPDLIKSHIEILDKEGPCVSVGQRKEAMFHWKDQRTRDFSLTHVFGDTPTEITRESWFVDSGVVWTCNFGLNRSAVDALCDMNKTLYGRNEAFSSDFAGTWGGEDGFIGLECFYVGIPVVAMAAGGNDGIRHQYHDRTDEKKYAHRTFQTYLEHKREELIYLLDLYERNVRNIAYVDRETMLEKEGMVQTEEINITI